MSSTINASTASGGGVITTADASGILQLQTAGTTALTIDGSQNVGIGTSSPAVKLDVAGAGEIRSTDGTTQTFIQSSSGSGGYIGTRSNDKLFFRTNNSDKMIIDTSGQQSSTIVGFSGTYTEYKCRAWVNFNGTGTVAIRASGNVSSITDNGVGDYTVNFTTAMPDANYSYCLSGKLLNAAGGNLNEGAELNGLLSVSNIPIRTGVRSINSLSDAAIVTCTISR